MTNSLLPMGDWSAYFFVPLHDGWHFTHKGKMAFVARYRGSKQQITMLNILFHIFSKNDQLNKISIFLLMIFVEMGDKKKMLLPE